MKCLSSHRVVVAGLLWAGGALFSSGAEVVISEFVAINDTGLQDEDGTRADWIEIQNRGTASVDLGGWYLTDDALELDKWRFPSVVIPAGGYLTVFASDKDRAIAGQPLHTNFRLSGDGEYLALVEPDGATVAFAYGPVYPQQYPDMGYGLSVDTAPQTLIDVGASARALIPFNDALGASWTGVGFNDSGWLNGTTGVGYDYGGLIGLDVGAMRDNTETVYIRVPFTVADPASLVSLTLRLRYEDGMIAYLNGVEVARDNVALPVTWNSGAAASRPDGTAIQPRDFDLSSALGELRVGQNVLAFHGLNFLVTSSDFLCLPELEGMSEVGGEIQTNYFAEPTPGGANRAGVAGVADEPMFSVPEGGYSSTLSVALSTETPGGVIRYTLNGSEPTEASAAYGAPIVISSSVVIRSRVFAGGYLPGPITSANYTMLAGDVEDFTSNLPLVVVNTFGAAVPNSVRIPAYGTFLDTYRGRASLRGEGDYLGPMEIEIRGSSSAGFAKKNYGIEIHDQAGEDRAVGLLGLPRESDWVLHGPYSDKSLMRNVLAYHLSNEIGRYAPRTRLVELFLDESGGDSLKYADYLGVYVLIEKIKRDNDRVDIAELQPGDNAEPEVTGGYILKKDRLDANDSQFTVDGGGGYPSHALGITEPRGGEITGTQRTWIEGYVDQFAATLYGGGFADPLTGYAAYADADSFIDHHLLVEVAKNIDGYRLSTFFHKDREGLLNAGPIWDYNLSFGNANYLEGWKPDSWYYTQVSLNDYPFWPRMFQDPEFAQRYLDRWTEFRRGPLETGRVLAKVDELADLLGEAQQRNFQRWQILGRYDWPNWHIPSSWQDEVDWMKGWIEARLEWMDNQFTRPAEFSPRGGPIFPGTSLHMVAPAGVIYYTTDGSDPRLPGGGVSPGADTFVSSVPLTSTVRVTARARVGNSWSGITAATFLGDPVPLMISEIMYHPEAPTPGGPFLREDYEFVELKNVGATGLDLNGVRFADGIDFDFTGSAVTWLPAGGRVVVVKNAAAFASRYGGGVTVAGTYEGSLANSGERLVLVGAAEDVIQDFEFKDGWYPITDGYGFSLVAVRDVLPMSDWNEKESWRRSRAVGGSPGGGEAPPIPVPAVFINEALTHTDLPLVDTIELWNSSETAANIGGWYLTDDRDQPAKFVIPPGTVIPPGGYQVFDENDFGGDFLLSSTGDDLFLFATLPNGDLRGYMHGFDFGASENGISFGRHVVSTGNDHFVSQSANSLGATNGLPTVGPVVINEVMYRPPEVLVNGAFWNNTEHEFIELHNITDGPVPLFDPRFGNGWRLRDAVSFTFPRVTIPARGYLLVVSFDPLEELAELAAFRAAYGIGSSVPVVGPFSGGLSNDSDSVELVRPDEPNLFPSALPMVLVDKVRYSDEAPWPVGPDGFGPSLQRLVSSAYGNDPTNWFGSGHSPGSVNAFNQAPEVALIGPVSGSVIHFPANVFFQATASDLDGSVLRVEFYVDGTKVGEDATSPYSYDWTGVVSGSYVLTAVARDTLGGFGISEEVVVTVIVPVTETIAPIPLGDTWKFLDTGTDQGTAWRGLGFDDSGWSVGAAQLGYGDGDEVTVVGFGPDPVNKYPTTYFRREFVLTDASVVRSLNVRFIRDDGGIVYLNGTEVLRSNMPEGAIGYGDYSAGVTAGGDETTFFSASVDPALLVDGQNVVAVEVHQANATSSDISFDLELSGEQVMFVPPVITVQPQSQSAREGDAVVLSVTATSELPMNYQWLRNGVPLPGATGPVLGIDPVDETHGGVYAVIVSTGSGSVTSAAAELTVLLNPQIVVQPVSQTVEEGDDVTFSVEVAGTLPMGFRWRKGAVTLTNVILNSHQSSITLSDVSVSDAGTYTVVLTNAAFYLPGVLSAPAVLTVRVDGDGDGMFDDWELAHGFNPADPSDALLDADGDLVTNVGEQIAGTDPRDGNSYLKIDRISVGASTVLTFSAVSNRSYAVEFSPSLDLPNWGRLGIVRARETNVVVNVIDAAPVGERYYRLVTPAGP